MMLKFYILFLKLGYFVSECSNLNEWAKTVNGIKLKTFVFWPNATVPFYINPEHFADDQAVVIRKSLAMVAFKTCVQFAPVLAAPAADQHVLTFINPEGLKRCKLEIWGHSSDKPHEVILGYECLKSPEIDMIVLRALGLPFEHTRMSRDLYIKVRPQNIEPHYIALFTKDSILPEKLAAIKYDRDSIMHFGERDYSKNGHRTIIFKDPRFTQNRKGLTPSDVLKVNLIYEPECRNRDRAQKVAICRSFPGVNRRKREIFEPPANKSLRVNPNITPPPHILAGITEHANTPKSEDKVKNSSGEDDSLKILGIQKEAHKIVELVYQLSAQALKKANEKYCNKSSNATSKFYYEKAVNQNKTTDVLGILERIADFAKTILHDTDGNLTEFCKNSETIEDYQSQCKSDNDRRCPKTLTSDCLSPEYILELVDKAQYGANETKKSDDNATTISKPNRRRKREVNSLTIPTSEEKDKDITKKGQKENDLTDAVKVIKEDRLEDIQKNDSTSKSSLLSSNITSTVKDGKEEQPRRKFTDTRYRAKDHNDDSDGDESDVSLDKNNLEPQKTLNNKELLQKVLTEGTGAVLRKQKEAMRVGKKTKTSESTEESTDTSENEENSVKATSKESSYKNDEKVPLEEIDVDMDNDSRPKQSQRTQKTGPLPKTVKLSKLNQDFYRERRWPDGDVIYVIEKLEQFDLKDLRKRLAEVNAILQEKTCVQLREVEAREAPGFDDYIILDHSPDYVTGRVGGKQNFGCIELFEGGQHKQHTAMVVMAMLGFYFEVARHDRDKHIRVHNRHIRADKLHHFEKLSKEVTLNIPYDFKSATHPSWQFWRKVGKKGISTVATYKEQDPDGSIMRSFGQNPELLSDSDILKINSVYGVECFQSNRASSKDRKEAQRMNDETVIQ